MNCVHDTIRKWDVHHFLNVYSKGNIYAGLNEHRPNLKGSPKKADIVAVRNILIDIDPFRKDDTLPEEKLKQLQKQPTTDEELERAIKFGQLVQNWFKENGFIIPPMAMSGNGAVLWCSVPRYALPSNEVRKTWEAKLQKFLSELNSNEFIQTKRTKCPHLKQVKLDTVVYDVTRISKVVGTKSVKGTPTTERPHRQSYWIDEPKRIDDDKLLQHILAIEVQTSKPKKSSKKSQPTAIKLPELSDYQKTTLQRAIRHPYVQMARRKVNPKDLSSSDWAFLSELRKEGILERDVLIYALVKCKDTKYQRDMNLDYVARTVDNFLDELVGISLQKGREQLECEMISILPAFLFTKPNKPTIICVGGACGIGKTTVGAKLTAQIWMAGLKALLVVPTHVLGDEWGDNLQEQHIPDIVQLYGITHESVGCPYAEKAKQLLSIGHSQMFKQRYCQKCKKKKCLHKQSLSCAKNSPVLIATHSHAGVHQIELDQTQTASMVQTEGRFLREDDVHKTIYRLHNVNIEPYPTRVYKSWKALFEYEFHPFLPAEVVLTGRTKDVWEWIQHNAKDKDFTASEVARGLGISATNTHKYLNGLTNMGYLTMVKSGSKGKGSITVFVLNKTAQTHS